MDAALDRFLQPEFFRLIERVKRLDDISNLPGDLGHPVQIALNGHLHGFAQ